MIVKNLQRFVASSMLYYCVCVCVQEADIKTINIVALYIKQSLNFNWYFEILFDKLHWHDNLLLTIRQLKVRLPLSFREIVTNMYVKEIIIFTYSEISVAKHISHNSIRLIDQ